MKRGPFSHSSMHLLTVNITIKPPAACTGMCLVYDPKEQVVDSHEQTFLPVHLFQMEYFQDDIYPDTRVTWQAALSAQEWLDGGDELQSSISLIPADMKPCEHNTAVVGIRTDPQKLQTLGILLM